MKNRNIDWGDLTMKKLKETCKKKGNPFEGWTKKQWYEFTKQRLREFTMED